MADNFVDLGAGWFLFEDEESRCSVVCDSQPGGHDFIFGPAAWNGEPGPLSGKAILDARPVVRGGWQQTGPDDWKWYSEDGLEYDEAPASWPRTIEARSESDSPLVRDVAGRKFNSAEELCEFLRGLAQSRNQCTTLVLSTAADRLEAATSLLASFEATLH
ncbi:hypothetical protein AB4Y45_32795 [Paraburkholderia sp. EG287A]|uniref:hypothetical protein n=1 Tax=Paraburkholderia sp. EG287A TaxID=3237012 RepID=UPI0034D240D5